MIKESKITMQSWWQESERRSCVCMCVWGSACVDRNTHMAGGVWVIEGNRYGIFGVYADTKIMKQENYDIQ